MPSACFLHGAYTVQEMQDLYKDFPDFVPTLPFGNITFRMSKTTSSGLLGGITIANLHVFHFHTWLKSFLIHLTIFLWFAIGKSFAKISRICSFTLTFNSFNVFFLGVGMMIHQQKSHPWQMPVQIDNPWESWMHYLKCTWTGTIYSS